MNYKTLSGCIVGGALLLIGSAAPASAQLSIGIGAPTLTIGIDLPVFPEFVRVPGYPVYYAPRINANYFFYDGMYWVYERDRWYASSWYDGPWGAVDPRYLPLFVLRVPVRYYRQPPRYFHGWSSDRPPHWGEHWGHDWEQRRRGWNRWDPHSAPAPAPLPTYQRQYAGDRYPHQEEQQRALHREHYRYQPSDPVARQRYRAQEGQTEHERSSARPETQAPPSPRPQSHQSQERHRPQPSHQTPQDRQSPEQQPRDEHASPHSGPQQQQEHRTQQQPEQTGRPQQSPNHKHPASSQDKRNASHDERGGDPHDAQH